MIETPSKPAYAVGFTPFAYEKLISRTNEGDGFPCDHKSRVYIMGGRDVNGNRVRRELRGTILVVFADYIQHAQHTRLWVQWKDGKRHLVHRKV